MAQVIVPDESGSTTTFKAELAVTAITESSSTTRGVTDWSATNGTTLTLYTSVFGTPKKDGYGFRGWSTSSGGSVVYGTSSPISVTVTESNPYVTRRIYAIFTQLSILHYDGNGSGVTNIPGNVQKYKGSTNALSSTIPVRVGYSFKGWNTRANGTGTTYQPGQNVVFSAGGNWYLYAIWKEVGTITTGNATMGVEQALTINNSTSGLEFTVSYSVAGQTGWISGPTPSSNKSLTWTPSLDLASYVTSDSQAALTLTLAAYSGSTLIGTQNKTITLYVPDYMVPTISSVTMTESAEMPEEFNGYWVKEASIPQFNVVAEGTNGSTIASYTVTIGGQSYTSFENPFNIGTLNVHGDLTAEIVATDTRGRTATFSINFTAYDHYAPSIMFAGDVYRDSDSPSDIVVNYKYTIAPVNNLNAKKIKIGYAPIDSGSYEYAPDIVPDEYSGEGSYTIPNTNYAKIYSVKIQVIDSVGSSSEYFVEVSRYGGTYIDVNPDDDTIAMHGEAPGDGADHWFEKILALEQGSSAKSITSNGTGYVRVAKVMSRRERSKNLAPKDSIYSAHLWNTNVNSSDSGMLGAVLETLSDGTYTLSFDLKVTSIPEEASTLQYGCYIYYLDSGQNVNWLVNDEKQTAETYAVGSTFKMVRTFTLTSSIVANASSFYVGVSCGQDEAFEASISEYQVEAGEEADPEYEPYVDMTTMNLVAPFRIKYITNEKDDEVCIRIQFNGSMNKVAFQITASDVGKAAMVRISESQWDLYIKKDSYDSVIDVTSIINPMRNSDLLLVWDNTVLSSLPSGAEQATAISSSTGTYYTAAPASISLAASTWKTTASLALPAGRYVISGTVRFAGSSTGRRTAILSTSSDSSTDLGIIFTDTRKSFSDGSGYNYASFCSPLQLGSNNTVYLNAWQNSGGALTTYGRLYAIRIV